MVQALQQRRIEEAAVGQIERKAIEDCRNFCATNYRHKVLLELEEVDTSIVIRWNAR